MLLLSTDTLKGYGLHRIFDFTKKAGYDGLDLVLTKQDFDNWDSDYVKNLSKEFGIPILSITAPQRSMNEKKVDLIIRLATSLGTQNITFFPPHARDSITWYTKYLPKVKRDTHLAISVKNVEPKFLFFIFPEYKDATLFQIKRVTGDTAFDLASVDNGSSLDILKAQKMLGSSIKNIYVSDKHGPKKGLLPGGAGGGTSYLPLESLFMKLRASGYGAFITLKVTPREIGVGTEEKIIQNLEYFKSYYKKHFLDFKGK